MKKYGNIIIRSTYIIFGLLMFAARIPAANGALMADRLIPLGNAAGISLSTEGVLVVGLSGVKTDDDTLYPARDAGIAEGDVIFSVDGKEINTAEDLRKCMESAGGNVTVGIRRAGEDLLIQVTPARAPDGTLRIGVWIRDNMLGIGTLTFYDPETGVYGALGHGINERNTGKLLQIDGGDLLKSTIEGIKPGEAGTPGELQGSYEPDAKIGSVSINTPSGIFGILDGKPSGAETAVAENDEIKLGDAKIISCVEGDTPREYSIRISAIYRGGENGNRDMLIEVTDKKLMGKTGGIVQGMSGSPIIQDGKLIGAVTHVLVNNPRKGYGIFIRDMLGAYEENGNKTVAGNFIAA